MRLMELLSITKSNTMRVEAAFFLCLFFLALAVSESVKPTHYSVPFNKTSFPSDFVFGVGSSAYQSEGAIDIDGKGPSIWDTFTKQHPEKIQDHKSGDVTVDFYHRYKSDIQLLKKIGFGSFRFSISWSRIFPGLTPFVTLFHWDVPQALEDEYGGFRSRKIVNDFREYADFCFKTFGDRVKNWVTVNEPYIFIVRGYDIGTLAPGRCSNYAGNCTAGDSATEPYIVGHHLLLSHAAAVKLYKNKYQVSQRGLIGITLVTHWFVPKTESAADREAASRALDFWFGWHADPIVYGDYPESMKSLVGDRLPKLTKAESKDVKGSYDFVTVNYYTANYAENAPLEAVNKSFSSDIQATLSRVGDVNNASKPIKEAIKDAFRIRYLDGHLRSILQAIKDGVNVKGYYIWSLSDSFEWDSGYTVRFGIIYVDYKNNLKRYLNYSAYWLKMFFLH
ncbi:vicianin hydrolase-like [Senna tora]|uniref:Vicianin hydrolase-like n=1 Tax=Senna tora TaxID=362788 RepID=A0A834TLH6_9FABA|nr:vicianin hydrolase-like [Senna tora]